MYQDWKIKEIKNGFLLHYFDRDEEEYVTVYFVSWQKAMEALDSLKPLGE